MYDEKKIKILLVMRDGSEVEGFLDVFQGTRLTDMLNAKHDKQQFLKILKAKVSLPLKKDFFAPWVLINRQAVARFSEFEQT